MRSVTHPGIVGQTSFRAPFLASAAADLSVTVAGTPAAFTLVRNHIELQTPLAVTAEVTITDVRYIASVAKQSTANASAVVVPANAARTYAKVFNDGATVKRFSVGANASATLGIPVAPGTGYEWPIAPDEAITVFCTAAESYQYEGD